MKEQAASEKWDARGYAEGRRFAASEADYDELASIYRAKGIPVYWDIFRAEILNSHLEAPAFDFQAYAAGFARACMAFFEKL